MASVAIIIDTLASGGVAKAAGEFIRCLSDAGLELTVFVREFQSVEAVKCSQNVSYKPWGDEATFSLYVKNGRIRESIGVIKNRILSIFHFRNFGKKIVDRARCRSRLDGKFDCVIGYQMIANDVTVMTLEKVDAPRKLLWVHGQKRFAPKDRKYFDSLYSKADKIVCVSKDTETRFRTLMPGCANKTVTIHNFYNIEEILRLAEQPVELPESDIDKKLIVSVGRISKEKGFDRVPEVAYQLKADGYRFLWVIIGDGNCRSKVEARITELGLTDDVLLLGYLKNPYPYMKQCDIYVQPSYSEGYCTSTVEAKILNSPVVTTNVPGMNEQFVSEENGLIVESSVEGIYKGVRRLLDDNSLRERIINELQENVVSNDTDLQMTLNVIKGI